VYGKIIASCKGGRFLRHGVYNTKRRAFSLQQLRFMLLQSSAGPVLRQQTSLETATTV